MDSANVELPIENPTTSSISGKTTSNTNSLINTPCNKLDDIDSEDLLDWSEDELLKLDEEIPEPEHITNNYFLDWDDTPAHELVKNQVHEGWVDFERNQSHIGWEIVSDERDWIHEEDKTSEIELDTFDSDMARRHVKSR